MLILKTKWFNKWASKNRLPDSCLKEALEDLKKDKGVSNLGGDLYKIRVSRHNEGKSGGYRTLIAYRKNERAVFIYAFAKNEKESLDKDELRTLKKLSGDLTGFETEEIMRQIKLGNLIELDGGR